MDFIRFLIHEDLYACLARCFRHNICSAWFLDIRKSTCFLLYYYIHTNEIISVSVYTCTRLVVKQPQNLCIKFPVVDTKVL